jgi:hypothetical protein
LNFELRGDFLILFSALRTHGVACRFEFTPNRQSLGTAQGRSPLRFGGLAELLASLVAIPIGALSIWSVAAAFVALVLIPLTIHKTESTIPISYEFDLNGTIFVLLLFSIPLWLLLAKAWPHDGGCDPPIKNRSVDLLRERKSEEPPPQLDDQPFGAKLLGAGISAPSEVAEARHEDAAAAKQINEIESLLE